MSFRRAVPLIAGLLAVLISVDAVAMPLSQASVWAERAKSRRPMTPVAAPAVLPAVRTPLSMRLVETHGPDNAAVRVRLIQDIHRHPEAQRLISEAVASEEHSLVAVEGAWDKVDLSAFREPVLVAALRPVIDAMLERNAMSGAAHATLVGRGPATFTGIDDVRLHAANVAAYRRALAHRADMDAALGRLAQADARLAAAWSDDLRNVIAACSAFSRGETTLADHVAALGKRVSTGPHIRLYLAALASEKSVDVAVIRRERLALLSELAEKLPAVDLQKLLTQAAALRLARTDDVAFHDALADHARAAGLDMAAFPSLSNYIQYQRAAAALDVTALLREVDQAEEAAVRAVARNPAEAASALTVRSHDLLPKLTRFSLTAAEWDLVSRRVGSLDAATRAAISDAVEFYSRAEDRDAAMANRILSEIHSGAATTATLVIGGFHTPGLARRLASAGVRVDVLRPRITNVNVDGTDYLTEFARERSPLERLMDGDAVFLAAPPMPDATRIELASRGASILTRAGRSFGQVAAWFSRQTGLRLVSVAADGRSVEVERYTDRAVKLRVVIKIPPSTDPVVVEPVRGWRLLATVAAFVLIPIFFSSIGAFAVPMGLHLATLATVTAKAPAGVILTFRLATMFVTAVGIVVVMVAVIHTALVAAGMIVVPHVDRLRSETSINAALARRADRTLRGVQRIADADAVVRRAMAMVSAVGFVDDDRAVAQGGKLVRNDAAGNIERIVLLLRSMRLSPGVNRYVLLRRAIGFDYDAQATLIGADKDPMFVWHKRLFWELYADMALLRHGRHIPLTVPYTVLHITTWGSAAIAGAASLFLISVWKDGRLGAARTLRIWQELFSMYSLRLPAKAWSIEGPAPTFHRRAFEFIAGFLLLLAGAAFMVPLISFLNFEGEVASTLIIVSGFLLVNFMGIVAFGRLIQENSNFYRDGGDEPPSGTPADDVPPTDDSPPSTSEPDPTAPVPQLVDGLAGPVTTKGLDFNPNTTIIVDKSVSQPSSMTGPEMLAALHAASADALIVGVLPPMVLNLMINVMTRDAINSPQLHRSERAALLENMRAGFILDVGGAPDRGFRNFLIKVLGFDPARVFVVDPSLKAIEERVGPLDGGHSIGEGAELLGLSPRTRAWVGTFDWVFSFGVFNDEIVEAGGLNPAGIDVHAAAAGIARVMKQSGRLVMSVGTLPWSHAHAFEALFTQFAVSSSGIHGYALKQVESAQEDSEVTPFKGEATSTDGKNMDVFNWLADGGDASILQATDATRAFLAQDDRGDSRLLFMVPGGEAPRANVESALRASFPGFLDAGTIVVTSADVPNVWRLIERTAADRGTTVTRVRRFIVGDTSLIPAGFFDLAEANLSVADEAALRANLELLFRTMSGDLLRVGGGLLNRIDAFRAALTQA